MLLLVALVGFLYVPGSVEDSIDMVTPAIPLSPGSEAEAEVTLPAGSEVPQAGPLPPPIDPNHPPGPFIATDDVLAAVRDAEIFEAGESERAGLIYLFHRWRSGGTATAAELPEWTEFPLQAPALRGSRHPMVLTLVDSPRKSRLEDNVSGVLRYWWAFGQDADGHLHKVNFINKKGRLPGGADVVFDGDFFRMYRYITRSGIEAQVPEWVTPELSSYRPRPTERSSGTVLKIVGGISLLGLVALFLMGRSEAPRPRRGRRVPRGGSNGD